MFWNDESDKGVKDTERELDGKLKSQEVCMWLTLK